MIDANYFVSLKVNYRSFEDIIAKEVITHFCGRVIIMLRLNKYVVGILKNCKQNTPLFLLKKLGKYLFDDNKYRFI